MLDAPDPATPTPPADPWHFLTARDPSEKEVAIESEGEKVGFLRYKLCQSEADLSTCINFNHLPGRFAHYAEQMLIKPPWPMAFFLALEVFRSFRRRGFGTLGTRIFREHAIADGARCGFLRVGWGDMGDDDTSPVWRQNLYAKEGWILLRNPIPEFVIPIMYLPLKQ